MALEQDLRTFLKSKLSFNDNQVFYQHLDRKPTSPFIWFIRNGDDSADSLDDLDGDEPFTVYFDVELYGDSATALQSLATTVRRQSNYTGSMGSGYVQDIEVSDQKDDYELQAQAETLPEYSASFRIAISGYAG